MQGISGAMCTMYPRTFGPFRMTQRKYWLTQRRSDNPTDLVLVKKFTRVGAE